MSFYNRYLNNPTLNDKTLMLMIWTNANVYIKME